MSDEPHMVEATDSGDGFKHWRLLRRSHGLYFYEEKTLEEEVYLIEEDGSEGAVVADAYWTPTHVSGLFDTSEAARLDAVATLPWLRKAFGNAGTSGS